MSGYTYLASPYSHPDPDVRERRYQAACSWAAKLMCDGETVFSPIAHSHPIEQHIGYPKPLDWWMAQDLPLLRCATKVKVLMLDGWERSKGVAREVAVATAALIPIEYIALAPPKAEAEPRPVMVIDDE